MTNGASPCSARTSKLGFGSMTCSVAPRLVAQRAMFAVWPPPAAPTSTSVDTAPASSIGSISFQKCFTGWEANAANRPDSTPRCCATVLRVRVHQLVLTRFNLRWATAGYRPDQDPGWLEERFELFERFCAPSVTSQTEEDFDWVIFCDEATSPEALDRLASLDGRIRVALVPPWPETGGSVERLLARHYARPDAQLVLSTRLDNDDALSRHALGRVRELIPTFLATGNERWLHNPALGYRLDVQGRRLFELSLHNSPFPTMFERAASGPVGPYVSSHGRLHEMFPTFQDDGARLWVQVVHGGNVSNQVRPGDREVQIHELGADFVIDAQREPDPAGANGAWTSELASGKVMTADNTRRLRARAHWLVAQARGDVLDVGRSKAITALLCAERGLRVLGIDVDASRIAYALAERERRPPDVADRVEFRVVEAPALDLPKARFDTVLVGDVLEHLGDERDSFLAAIVRLCKPDGVIAITTPFGAVSPPVHGFSVSSLVEQVGKQLRVDSLEVVDGSLCVTARPGAMSREERDVVVLELQRLYEREVAALRAELQLAREKGYGKSVLAEELDRRLAERRYDLRRARWKLRARRRSRWARLG